MELVDLLDSLFGVETISNYELVNAESHSDNH